MLSKELIEKFLKNECSDEQKQAVLNYLEKHTEGLDAFLNEEEWQQFTATTEMPEATSDKMLEQVKKATFGKRLGAVKSIRFALAAASVVLFAIVGIKLLNKNSIGVANTANADVKKVGGNSLVFRVNTTNYPMQLVMEDGSKIELYPKSSIAFNTPFVKDGKRDIYLKGEAFFKVAKDKTKPFTVFSETIATTALGTSFTIRSFEEDSYIKVHLHTGKVVVKSADVAHTTLEKEMYLLPDNILMYDKAKMLASINRLDSKNNLVKVADGAANSNRIPNWYMFSNQPLSQVFSQLEEMYGVTIAYTVTDIDNMYFIGKFDKQDAIETILETITKLNGLIVKKHGRTYKISK